MVLSLRKLKNLCNKQKMMTGQGNNRMPPLLVVVSKSLENLVLKKRRLLEDRNRSSLQKNLVVLNQVRDLLLLRHQLVAVSQSKISNS
jgi:hypothetical protein